MRIHSYGQYLWEVPCGFSLRFQIEGGSTMDNLQTKSEKKYYIPLEVNETSKEFFIANGYNLSTDAVWTKIGHRTVRAIMIPATKEQYLEYMRPLWREDKQGQRASKQEDESKMQPVSLDQLYESTEYEVSDS